MKAFNKEDIVLGKTAINPPEQVLASFLFLLVLGMVCFLLYKYWRIVVAVFMFIFALVLAFAWEEIQQFIAPIGILASMAGSFAFAWKFTKQHRPRENPLEEEAGEKEKIKSSSQKSSGSDAGSVAPKADNCSDRKVCYICGTEYLATFHFIDYIFIDGLCYPCYKNRKKRDSVTPF